ALADDRGRGPAQDGLLPRLRLIALGDVDRLTREHEPPGVALADEDGRLSPVGGGIARFDDEAFRDVISLPNQNVATVGLLGADGTGPAASRPGRRVGLETLRQE